MTLCLSTQLKRASPALSRLLAAGLALALIPGCESDVPAGRIRIKNDFRGKVDSTIKVQAGGSNHVLTAGQSVILPEGTTSIIFSYTSSKKGTREYGVRCPADLQRGITIKLIDVHMGKIAGGCEKMWSTHK